MDWEDLRYILAIEQTGTLTAAAERLGVARTTVGRRIEAAEALELGLVSKVVDDDKLEAETEAFVARFTAMAPIAMARQKQNLLASMRLPMEDTLALEAQNMVRCFRTEDHIEGVAALREKRAQGFKGA